jgi:membrane protease YdiL (CAAX protease family)
MTRLAPKRARKRVAAIGESEPPPKRKTWGERFAELHPRRFFLDTWRELDEEAAKAREARAAAGLGYDWRPLVALVVGAVCLTFMEYFGHSGGPPNAVLDFHELVAWAWGDDAPEIRTSRWFGLAEFAWWSGWRVLGYLVVPALVVKLVFRERVRDHGLETKGFTEHAWIYGVGYLVVLVGVIFVANFDDGFRDYYPFYRRAFRSWSDFLGWEVLYAAQFFALEFFFRGFWLRSMRGALGSQAIFAMVVPYCMIHFGKPFLECLAAIIAGVFLGTLAMKTRSIWSGFLIHVSVAVSMDVAALLATGHDWPTTFWPPT